jgi:Potential Queuosine, Q, salvage protein family
LRRARHVRLGRCERLADKLVDRPVPAWDAQRHFKGSRDRTITYLLVVDTINFSFWGGQGGGYWQLAERVRDIFQASDALADPARLARMTPARLAELIGPFSMLEQRARALRELGRRGFDGLVKRSAAATARALAENLASYADVVEYDGRDVPILKRAQILPADLHGAGVASYGDLGDLTCFADYKLPQVLRHFGVIEYSEPLRKRVDGLEELQPGEPAEVEIRAATVLAVERLRDALGQRGRQLKAVELDWILWDISQSLYPVRPYHRTRTIFY